MGTCGSDKAALTNSVFVPNTNNQPKEKDIKEEINKKEEQEKSIKKNESKEEIEINQNQNSLDENMFAKKIDIYTMPGEPHPPFEIINKKLSISLCRIISKDNSVGIAFFCLIPFPTVDYPLPVLIINSNVLSLDEISIGKNINIILNTKKKFVLKIDESRKIYKKNGIAMIEIKYSDGLDCNNFLSYYNVNSASKCMFYYMPQNNYFFLYKNDKIDCCLAMMNNIDFDKYKFMFSIDPVKEASGSPIITKFHEVIGLHIKDMEGKYLHDYIRDFYQIESIKENPKDEITIIYQIIKELPPKLNLFGKKFVDNNKSKCKIRINNYPEQNLVESIDNQSHKELFNFKGKFNEIIVTLKGLPNITDASDMFKNCDTLSALPDIGKWDTSNVTNMSGLFWKCSTVIHISNSIENWNMENVKSISGIFADCALIMYLPDISKWNTKNIENIDDLFHNCKNLRKVPDISIWNINKVTSLNFIFNSCQKLLSLPDLSKWNTSNITEIIGLFEDCQSLKSLPDISAWNTSNMTNFDGVFNLCKLLTSLPDLSKWDTSNVTSMQFTFQGCESLTVLPDLSTWNTNKVTSMNCMFNLCHSLTELPDITKWNTSNVTNMVKMFNMCENIKIFPDIIAAWDISKMKDNTQMLYGCPAAVKLLESYEEKQ
jgi:surface protein